MLFEQPIGDVPSGTELGVVSYEIDTLKYFFFTIIILQ